MNPNPKQTVATVIPCLCYRDAPAAIEWLCNAFGFAEQLVVPDDNNGIAHAQLKFGKGMIMLSSARGGGHNDLMRQPDEAGGSTQAAYVIVEDADGHYNHAKEAGAEIVMEIADQHYGGRVYTCRDLEGHVWSFGSYDPWSE